MSIKITPDKYPKIIEIYNSEGKAAAYSLIRHEYGIKNPTCVMKRLKSDSSLGYDPETDRFETDMSREEDIFLGLEELCGSRSKEIRKTDDPVIKNDRVKAMENMVHTLISDRLLELSRYVLLDPVSNQILIDKNGMQADGYQVIIN